jgi:hypothetical protein
VYRADHEYGVSHLLGDGISDQRRPSDCSAIREGPSSVSVRGAGGALRGGHSRRGRIEARRRHGAVRQRCSRQYSKFLQVAEDQRPDPSHFRTVLGKRLNDPKQFVASVALVAGELHQLASPLHHLCPFDGLTGNGDAPPPSELEQSFVAEQAKGA